MYDFRMLSAALSTACLALAADTPVNQAVARFDNAAEKTPAIIAVEYRLTAAAALKDRYPGQSQRLVAEAIAGLRDAGPIPMSSAIPHLLKDHGPELKLIMDGTRPERPPEALAKKIG